MQQKEKRVSPEVLPFTGKSRWSKVARFSPVSRETFRKLSIKGRAPQPERMGIRCTYYDNQELHKWLADPINYQAGVSHADTNKKAAPVGGSG